MSGCLAADALVLPWARRPETSRLLAELRAGTNRWSAIVIGEFTRAFGASIQYSTTYPLLQHFQVELWIPEIGGRVDKGSATTEMLLGMLGGTSKQERDLIRTRVRTVWACSPRKGNATLADDRQTATSSPTRASTPTSRGAPRASGSTASTRPGHRTNRPPHRRYVRRRPGP